MCRSEELPVESGDNDYKVEATIWMQRQWFESKSWGSDLNESGGNIWKQRQGFESEGLPLESWDNAQRTVKDKKGFPPTSDFEVGGEAGVWVCQMKFLSWVWVCRKFYPFWLFKLRINAKVLKKCKLSIMSDKNKEERHKQCNISKDSSWNYQLPTHLCSAPDRNKSLALLWLFFCEWLKLIKEKDKIIPL